MAAVVPPDERPVRLEAADKAMVVSRRYQRGTSLEMRQARVDAPERHLWLVRKGGIPRVVSILTRGGHRFAAGRVEPPPTLNPACAQQLAMSSGCTPARLPIRPQRAAIPVFSRETWQRDLARAENREFAGVLEMGLVS
jgi:hypothetical protein